MANSEDKPAPGEEFLSRWSRRKQQVREEQAAPPAAVTPATQEKPPELPPVEGLNMESDFRGFLHPKVDESLRRAALKKLFHEPHFNVMDGLDTYIDDYSVSDPIPEAMLKTMRQAQDIIVAGNERREEAAKHEEAERQRLAAAGAEEAGAEKAATEKAGTEEATDTEHAGTAAASPAIAPEPVLPLEAVAVQTEINDKVTPRS
jgi:hypothetical protein